VGCQSVNIASYALLVSDIALGNKAGVSAARRNAVQKDLHCCEVEAQRVEALPDTFAKAAHLKDTLLRSYTLHHISG
jgi:hypothetical protein